MPGLKRDVNGRARHGMSMARHGMQQAMKVVRRTLQARHSWVLLGLEAGVHAL